MPTLIDRAGRRPDPWIRFDGGPDTLAQGARALVSLAQWIAHRDAWKARAGEVGVLLSPADDPAAIAGDLDAIGLVAVDFPAFTDGRGYSIGRLLRERHGWTGELRATGEVLRDQLLFMARCGFDSFALADGENPDTALGAFDDFSEVYQGAVDRGPLFARRRAAAQGA